MSRLSQFLLESKKHKDFSEYGRIVIAPGRFNPPHRGHKLVIDKLVELGETLDATPVVLIIDSKKYGPTNPLTGTVRKQYLQKMFPTMQFEVYENPFVAIADLAETRRVVPVGGVAGADRGNRYRDMIGKIFGEGAENQYRSEILHRDPDAQDATGFSGTKVRQAATEGDIAMIRTMTGLNDDDARNLQHLLVSEFDGK